MFNQNSTKVMQDYRPSGVQSVKAVLVTEHNLTDVAKECGGIVRDGGVYFPSLVLDPEYVVSFDAKFVVVGLYLVWSSDDGWFVMDKSSFERNYVKMGIRGQIE